MISGRPPWHHFKTQISALYHIGSTNDPPQLPDELSEDGKDFVLWCLERDPVKRPNVLRLLEHPFITEPFQGMRKRAANEHLVGSVNDQFGLGGPLTAAGVDQNGESDESAATLNRVDKGAREDEIANFLLEQHKTLLAPSEDQLKSSLMS